MYVGYLSAPSENKTDHFFSEGTFFSYVVECNDQKQKLMRITSSCLNVAMNIDYLHE